MDNLIQTGRIDAVGLLDWAKKRVQALARTGLACTSNPYDAVVCGHAPRSGAVA